MNWLVKDLSGRSLIETLKTTTLYTLIVIWSVLVTVAMVIVIVKEAMPIVSDPFSVSVALLIGCISGMTVVPYAFHSALKTKNEEKK